MLGRVSIAQSQVLADYGARTGTKRLKLYKYRYQSNHNDS